MGQRTSVLGSQWGPTSQKKKKIILPENLDGVSWRSRMTLGQFRPFIVTRVLRRIWSTCQNEVGHSIELPESMYKFGLSSCIPLTFQSLWTDLVDLLAYLPGWHWELPQSAKAEWSTCQSEVGHSIDLPEYLDEFGRSWIPSRVTLRTPSIN